MRAAASATVELSEAEVLYVVLGLVGLGVVWACSIIFEARFQWISETRPRIHFHTPARAPPPPDVRDPAWEN